MSLTHSFELRVARVALREGAFAAQAQPLVLLRFTFRGRGGTL